MWFGHSELCGILGIWAESQRDEAMFDIYQRPRLKMTYSAKYDSK
jgi:hypothetical protein